MPSLWEEPFGRTVAESIRSGIPVLASKKGGVPEIISKQELGVLFDPNEVDSLEKSISSIRQFFLAGRYDSAAIAQHAEMYSPEQIYYSYHAVYESALQHAQK